MASFEENTTQYSLIQTVLEGNAGDMDEKEREAVDHIKGDKVTQPVISLSYNTASIVAGADETFNAIRDYLEERDIDARLNEIGSLGLITAEPLMDVQLPGKARVTFSNVFPEKVSDILDAVFNNIIPKEYVLGQHPTDLHEPWENIAYVNELPFFQTQKRLNHGGEKQHGHCDGNGYIEALFEIRHHVGVMIVMAGMIPLPAMAGMRLGVPGGRMAVPGLSIRMRPVGIVGRIFSVVGFRIVFRSILRPCQTILLTLNVELTDHFFQRFCRMPEHADFLIAEFHEKRPLNPVLIQHRGKTHADLIDTVISVNQARNCQDTVFTPQMNPNANIV